MAEPSKKPSRQRDQRSKKPTAQPLREPVAISHSPERFNLSGTKKYCANHPGESSGESTSTRDQTMTRLPSSFLDGPDTDDYISLKQDRRS